MTITLTKPAASALDEQTATDLDRAADILAANGLVRGGYYSRAQAAAGTPLAECRTDLTGAINTALGGSPVPDSPLTPGVQHRYVRAMCAVLVHGRIQPGLGCWSDHPARTTEHAVALLRATATTLRGGAA